MTVCVYLCEYIEVSVKFIVLYHNSVPLKKVYDLMSQVHNIQAAVVCCVSSCVFYQILLCCFRW